MAGLVHAPRNVGPTDTQQVSSATNGNAGDSPTADTWCTTKAERMTGTHSMSRTGAHRAPVRLREYHSTEQNQGSRWN
jgi:hypothetical protein